MSDTASPLHRRPAATARQAHPTNGVRCGLSSPTATLRAAIFTTTQIFCGSGAECST
nr:MAG TPA: hypothetical protein [Caudoviricetes sp.]